MLQTHTTSSKNVYHLYDFQGTIMPAVKDAEWLISVCLYKTGSSGYLGPDTSQLLLLSCRLSEKTGGFLLCPGNIQDMFGKSNA